MCDVTEFEKRQIVGARMAGASVFKAAEAWFSRATISGTTIKFKKIQKNL